MRFEDILEELISNLSIEIDPDICGGVPVIRGTRVPVYQVLVELSDDQRLSNIAEDLDLDIKNIRSLIKTLSVYFCNVSRSKPIQTVKGKVELMFSMNDDLAEDISCIYCRRETFCEYTLTVRRNGEIAWMGIHAACLEPLKIRNAHKE